MSRAFKTLVVALVAVVAGCSDSADNGTPPVDGGTSADGSVGGALVVDIEAAPSLGPFGADFAPTLDGVSISVTDFRVIGDSAPGDARTTVPALTLTFSESDERTLRFDDAPIGLYSRVRARVDHYLVTGTNTVDQTMYTWEIESTPSPGIEIDFSFAPVALGVGQQAVVELEARLDRAYDEINWDQLTPVGNLLRVDDSSPMIDEVLEKIEETFTEHQ